MKKEPDVFPSKDLSAHKMRKPHESAFGGLKTKKRKIKTEPDVFRNKKPGRVFWLKKKETRIKAGNQSVRRKPHENAFVA